MTLLEVECEGYRGFSAHTKINLRRLTVIFGRNNSGKTTLARLPIFAMASLTNDVDLYALSFGDLRFGSSFVDLANLNQAHPRLSFGLRWRTSHRMALELQHVTTKVEQRSVRPHKLIIDNLAPIIFDLRKSSAGSAYRLVRDSLNAEDRESLDDLRRQLSAFMRGIIHIPGGRPRIESTYASREPVSWTVAEVPYLLATRHSLMNAVASWFQTAFDGTRVDIDQAAFAFRLIEERDGLTVSLAESGRGTQSVLSVVALLKGIATGERSAQLVVVEEPEEHLHQSAHGAVADLLIECSNRVQTVVETHSENLILRLRRRIAEGLLGVEDLALYYVDSDRNIIPISIDEYGAADNWPAGVFEDDVQEAQAIVDAKLAGSNRAGE